MAAVCAAAVALSCVACSTGADTKKGISEAAGFSEEDQDDSRTSAHVEISEIDGTKAEKTTEAESREAEEPEIKGLIEEQSFEVSLENWGDVRFVSCRPPEDGEDVRFYLVKEDEIIYTFPEEFEENQCSWTFENINFVAFRDVNGDGRMDVLVSSNYITGAGADAAVPFSHIKIFNQYRDGFLMNGLLASELDERHLGSNISSAMGYIENQDLKSYYSRSEAIAFSRQIMIWLKEDNRQQLASVVAYPITVWEDGQKIVLEDEQEFLDHYPAVFYDNFKEKVLSLNADDITSTEAIFVGNGELWFSPFEDGYKIIAINN